MAEKRDGGKEPLTEREREALQELARAIVREASTEQDPEREARLEGNKMAAEAAKAQVLVGSGSLVGMAAVVGIMPEASQLSPVLYFAVTLVILSIFAGIVWMHDLAIATATSDEALRVPSRLVSVINFILGLFVFSLYVLWNSPGDESLWFPDRWFLSPETPREQARVLLGVLVLCGIAYFGAFFLRWRSNRRRSQESEPPSNSA